MSPSPPVPKCCRLCLCLLIRLKVLICKESWPKERMNGFSPGSAVQPAFSVGPVGSTLKQIGLQEKRSFLWTSRSELSLPFSLYLYPLLPLPPRSSDSGLPQKCGSEECTLSAVPGLGSSVVCLHGTTSHTPFLGERPLNFLCGTHLVWVSPTLRFKVSSWPQPGHAGLTCPMGTEGTVPGAQNSSMGLIEMF